MRWEPLLIVEKLKPGDLYSRAGDGADAEVFCLSLSAEGAGLLVTYSLGRELWTGSYGWFSQNFLLRTE